METINSRSQSRRKRKGSGPTQTPNSLPSSKPAIVATSPHASEPGSRFGRYERNDLERVESTLAGFISQRLTNILPTIHTHFFSIATPQERNLPQLQTAFYNYFMYGWRDANGQRVVDLFHQLNQASEHAVKGRLLAALEACLQARLTLVDIHDINVRKQRVRGRDILRDEKLALRDHNIVQLVKPGNRLLAWLVPWGTSWQATGLVVQIDAYKANALEQAIKTLCNSLQTERWLLADQQSANLFWMVFRVSRM